MEITQKFGLEVKLFLFQIVNFLVIAFILKKFLYVPLKKILDERKSKIEKSLLESDSAKIILENAKKEKEKLLFEAKNNAATLIETARVSIVEAKKRAIAEAARNSERILDDAKQRAAEEFEIMNNQVEKMSIDVSKKIILRILSDLFSNDEKQKLISRALKKIDEKIKN
ncbi:MAG: ATP synthase F0 subunit B [Endomicrobium sp.]|jgi:F-type H+-transporting ATPase subunit b|nr:ATP synthase F0 subunit B [Endomicrobium sp.]